jgi:DNA-binding NtrC family response regulator
MKKILVVDDEAVGRKLLRAVLGGAEGYALTEAETGKGALAEAARNLPDAVILDLNLPDMDGLKVLEKLKALSPRLPVVMLTSHNDAATALKAVKLGAFHYLTKPFDQDQLLVTLQRAMEKGELLARMEALKKEAGKGRALSRLLGESGAVRSVADQIGKVADSLLTVLIQGETGTGKELAARALHEESPRRDFPFVALDCGALAENLLESELFGHEKGAFTGADRKKEGQLFLARGGTLFLDEVGNLPLGLQSKLLRVLQERQVKPVGAEKSHPIDVRFLAATNISLEEAAQAGRFRQDLYYRLAEFTLALPPLREREGDIPLLAARFAQEASVELRKNVGSLSAEALEALADYPWPGNIRELRNVIRQAVLLASGQVLEGKAVRAFLGKNPSQETPGPVEVPLAPGLSLKKIAEQAAESAEKQAIRNVLRSTGGNKSKASKILKTDYKTLHLKIKKYSL